ncbi:hypothetical protein SAMN04489798_5671 [Pseudomonas arsenicoxydans]|uniref:Uncharacterized protein n=1 Tax=Pseudomonas arsenicoxydans TaxID=702115 RepID=A0A1H0SIT3_9PSED|nr:hypothetical protein [Pseudomonas arsenicoxydans]SDP41056.1 hypothetical protein SAMN04489798_5671 [Pseudomonas arsenicoxydans]
MPPFTIMLRPIEMGQVLHRALHNLPPKYHVRLKHQGRLLAVLQGDTYQEATERAQRLVAALSITDGGVTYEQA